MHIKIVETVTNFLTKGKYGRLRKDYDILRQTLRPSLGTYKALGRGVVRPAINMAYYLEDEVAVFSDIILKLRQEILRRGFTWKPKFALKCATCSTEHEEIVETCECGSSDFKKPDKQQLKYFSNNGMSFLECGNLNGQSLKEVLSDYEFNLDVADDAYLLIPKSYIYNDEGEIIASFPKEILSVDPRDIKKIHDLDGVPGGRIWICPEHREPASANSRIEGNLLRCKICGKRMHEAHFETIGQRKKYYLEGEVKHSSKYYPSIIYGFPPILKMLDGAWAYHHLEKRVRKFYERGRPPGLLTFPTSNIESLRKFMDETKEQLKQDPYTVPIVGYDPTGKVAASFIRLMEDPNPQMLEVKKELRERMGSRFGVSLIFQGDVSTSGGLNQEGLQITVTNRAVEFGQAIYNEKILPWICKQFGITDFLLQLNPSEEMDKMAEKQRFAQEISNARGMWEMGFEVEFKNEQFSFSGEAKPRPEAPVADGFPSIVESEQRFTGEPASVRKEIDEFDDLNSDMLIKDFVSDALQAIKAGALYPFYKDVAEAHIPTIHGIIREAFEQRKLSLREMVEKIVEKTGLDEEKARLIARTETSAVANTAREIGWHKMEEERGEKFKFRWSVTHDHRTSEICKEIERRVGAGKTLEELKAIVKEVSQKHIPGWLGWAQLIAHPNERSTVVRVV